MLLLFLEVDLGPGAAVTGGIGLGFQGFLVFFFSCWCMACPRTSGTSYTGFSVGFVDHARRDLPLVGPMVVNQIMKAHHGTEKTSVIDD